MKNSIKNIKSKLIRQFWNRNEIEKTLRAQNFIPIKETMDEDVFIAGFPKSGNTWMQNLVTGLLLDSNSFNITPQLVNEVVPDEHAMKYYKRIFPRMVFKTHELPCERHKNVIHIVRDGRDAMVSYYKMEINRNKHFKYSLRQMIVEGSGVFPTKWHLHCKKWSENPHDAKIIVIRFEDLLTNPLPCLKDISSFLKIDLNDSRLLEIYESNNISVLRRKVTSYGWDYDQEYTNKKSRSFFRKGEIGNFKDEMSSKTIDYFVKESNQELMKFGYLNLNESNNIKNS